MVRLANAAVCRGQCSHWQWELALCKFLEANIGRIAMGGQAEAGSACCMRAIQSNGAHESTPNQSMLRREGGLAGRESRTFLHRLMRRLLPPLLLPLQILHVLHGVPRRRSRRAPTLVHASHQPHLQR